MFTRYCLYTFHFTFLYLKTHTLSFSVFKLKLLVLASLSLSITLSFKPHFATSMNRWCHHSPPVSNIVPVLSQKNQWRKGQRAGKSPSDVKRRKPVDQMVFLGQVQYRPVSINWPESDVYPSMVEMIPVWPVFNPERNHYVSIPADPSERKIPTILTNTVRNCLRCLRPELDSDFISSSLSRQKTFFSCPKHFSLSQKLPPFCSLA